VRESLLEVTDARVVFPVRRELGAILRRRPANELVSLDGVSLSLGANETIGVVGESGSGKTTLAKAIVRLVELEAGSVRFDGRVISGLQGRELANVRRRIQLVYQDPYSSLNPRLRIDDAITEPAIAHGLVDSGRRDDLAWQLLDRVGLSPTLARRRPRALSGGQRQRVAIARALAAQPDVLLADEAVSALDMSIQAQILNLFAEIQQDLGIAILFISHQLSVVSHVADHVAVMYLGRIVEHGSVAEVFQSPAHPYTEALLASQPGRHRRGARRLNPVLRGELPSPLAIPSGCRFRTRCPLAEGICAEVDPAPVALSESHASWCHVLPRRLGVEPRSASSSSTLDDGSIQKAARQSGKTVR
jgi:oligopeptide/dipeptide ABC transporter ATP-binding protein